MPIVLNRNVSRVVSKSLVATLTAQGLVLRRPYGQRKVLVTWEELDSEYMRDARTGGEAFERPLPSRWLPAVGESVWIKPRDTAWRGEVVKVLAGLGEEIVVARLKRKREVRVLLSQTRPLGEREDSDDTGPLNLKIP